MSGIRPEIDDHRPAIQLTPFVVGQEVDESAALVIPQVEAEGVGLVIQVEDTEGALVAEDAPEGKHGRALGRERSRRGA